MKKLITLIFIVFIFIQCKKEETVADTKITGSYISGYIELQNISLAVWNFSSNSIIAIDSFLLYPTGKKMVYDFFSNSKKYIYYSVLYNDINYKTDTTLNLIEQRFQPVLTDTISKIFLVTNSDFDAKHPAGSIMNDILTVNYQTATEFIKSNYTNKESIKQKRECAEEFNKKNHFLVGENLNFKIQTPPTVTAQYTFTLVYETINGKKITTKSAPVLIKGKE